MKKACKTISLTVAALAAVACSNIDESDRLIYVKPAPVARTVLIEDFTGQRCSNCPSATEEIEKIRQEYGDSNVVAVGIHSGPLGFAGNAKIVGLMTDTGNEYYNSWSIDHQPMGIVNRVGQPSDYTSWMTLVSSEIQKTTPITLGLTNVYSENDNKASVSALVFSSEDFSGKLQLWLVEDSIVTFQMMPDGSGNSNYVHNHVFREAVNGTWGEDISLKEGEADMKEYSFTLDAKYVPENVSVVAFVYDDNGVQQVAKKALVW